MKLLQPFWKIVSLLILLFSAVPAYGRLFEYMPNCHGLESDLDHYFKECHHLADAAKDAVDSIGDNVVAQKLVTAYFNIHFVEANGRTVARHEDWQAWENVKMYIGLVQTFLRTGMYPSKIHTPHLFCDDDFPVEQTWQTAAIGKDGNYLRRPSNNEFFTINEIYGLFGNKHTEVPYYIPVLNAYYFDVPGKGHCGTDSLGETWHGMHGGHDGVSRFQATNTLDTEVVIICTGSHDDDTVPTLYLGESGWQDPADGEALDMLVPVSGTVYHELFHLVSGRIGYRPDMPPSDYLSRAVEDFAFDLEDALQLDRDHAARNAETYVFFSLAYWYWQHDWDNGKKRVTFYPGYAVYDDWI